MLFDIKGIFIEALDIEINENQPIMDQLVDIVHKYNVDTDGQDKLLLKAEKKFEHKILEIVSGKIAIDQIKLSNLIQTLEEILANVTKLFEKLCDVPSFTQDIKVKLQKIDSDTKASAGKLALEPSTSSVHFGKINYLTDLQAELLREEVRIRECLMDIQRKIIPQMDIMQKRIEPAKNLLHDTNFLVTEHIMELLAEVPWFSL